MMVSELMKRRTAQVHGRVEQLLGLLDEDLSAARLTRVVEAFYGFWAGNEEAIEQWAHADPAMSAELQWSRRQRTESLAQDLVLLGVSRELHQKLPRSAPVFEHFERPEVFGWLYVTEGSTLGGAIINRHLSKLSSLCGIRLRTFKPYAEGPMHMWRSYKSALQRYVSDDVERTAAVVDAAATTFEALERWLMSVVAAA